MSSTLKYAAVSLAITLAIAGVIALVDGNGYKRGRAEVQLANSKEQATLQQRADGIREASSATTTNILNERKVEVETIYVQGEAFIKEVPIYVPAKTDGACTVPYGAVSMFDRPILAANGQPSEALSAGGSDDGSPAAGDALPISEWIEQPSGVQLSDMAKVNTANAKAFADLRSMYLKLRKWNQESGCYMPG